MMLYPNNLKNWELDKEAPQNFYREKHGQMNQRWPHFFWIYAAISLSFFPLSLNAAAMMSLSKEPTATEAPVIPPSMIKASPTSSYLSISLKERATDLLEAFNILKREKTADKVFFQFSDHSTISNLIDVTLLPSSSLFLFRYNTSSQGIRLQIVKVEDIVGVGYN